MSSALVALSALGQASRLALFRRLVQAGPAGLTVGDLRSGLGLPGATTSNHLNVLREAGLVRDSRDGRSIVCRADYERMNALVAYLTENCCGGAGCDTRSPVCPAPSTLRDEP